MHWALSFIPNFALSRYRLGSFAISYFTPKSQFAGNPPGFGGGLGQRHQFPGTTGAASVSLDKLLELIANFSFLVFGIVIAVSGAWLPGDWRRVGILFAMSLLVFPLAYLLLMLIGRQPLTWLMGRLPQRLSDNKLSKVVRESKGEISRFCGISPYCSTCFPDLSERLGRSCF